VTTAWVSSYGFSYLTSFSNDPNYFFIPRTNNGFTIDTWNESSTKNKITRDKMNEFLNQINNQYNIGGKVMEAINNHNTKTKLLGLLTLVFLIISVVTLIGWIMNIEGSSNKLLWYLMSWVFSLAIFAVVGSISIVFCCRKTEFIVDKEVITATSGNIENFFHNWNSQYFVPQGCYVMAPRNLRYLQFVLDTNVKFSFEDHAYPYDIIPRTGNY